MASIKIPTPLRQSAGNNATVTVAGGTVGEAIADLVAQFPGLETHLYDGGKLRSFVNIFLGDEDIRFLQGIETPINAEDKLRIVPAIAGG